MTDSLAVAYRRLASAQKGHARGAPAYSVYVNRRLGRALAAFAFRAGWTPNAVTGISALNTAAALVLLIALPATVWTGLLVAVLLVLGYAWDSADGQLARLRGGGSLSGEWLDHFVDAVKIAALHLVVLVALWLRTPVGGTPWALVPLAYSVIAVVTFFGMLLNDLLKGKKGVASTHRRGGGTLGRSMLLLPTDFGVVCLVFVLWGWTTGFLVAYTALAAASGAFLMLAAVRWFREIRALDGDGA
ncbi:CDP-alcohol phosphatidyltransferase family protein [Microbacterium resistens]|uniref:CDP-alcohol phosphatidyltransferase family protein n=1 Tax=Microbacterium resistens TaxID=156977 RepID=A0ABY3RQN7_9MICO|nr:CDP-alcohol phosphatidyltransferase family protein [Microbacterium resistens]MBW1638795.1 CDP-alcohol phosphatidyltransferase family protein [Microbacterium resistens]UGS25268.1 CDP-alcohol phosphatidyltransferase family protein [Microbacterium resistens]